MDYIEDTIKGSMKDYVVKLFTKQVNGWMSSTFSKAAMSKLSAIQWSADATWKICEYITKNCEIMECREMLRANAYFEKTVYNTLKSIEVEFTSDSTLDNAYLFDAVFKFFKSL